MSSSTTSRQPRQPTDSEQEAYYRKALKQNSAALVARTTAEPYDDTVRWAIRRNPGTVTGEIRKAKTLKDYLVDRSE